LGKICSFEVGGKMEQDNAKKMEILFKKKFMYHDPGPSKYPVSAEKPNDLLPCPFCYGSVEGIHYSWGVIGVITCRNCKTKFVIPWNEAESPKDLMEAWNRRANDET
jgi:hypothetical protein